MGIDPVQASEVEYQRDVDKMVSYLGALVMFGAGIIVGRRMGKSSKVR